MKKTVIAATFAVPLLLTSVAAMAFGGSHGGHQGGREGGCGMNDRQVWQQLEITDAQKEELQQLRETFREQRGEPGERAEARAEQREAMQALMMSDTFDEAKAQALVTQMTEQHQERQLAMLKQRHEMMSVLTDEQKSQLVELQAEKREECAQQWEERAQRMRDR
uniref:CpxP family protein n=1 Tax=Thaumasiovibrio occultus TaxID=1891184 RepID=UPI00131BBC4A|nr:CpxP family protein [Thaumasiovibrio occultus]